MRFPRKELPGIALSLSLAILVVDIALTFLNVRFIERVNWEIARSHEVIASLESVISLLKDTETGARGFLLTGDDGYLKPHQEAVHGIVAELDRVAAMTRGDTRRQGRVIALRRLANAEVEELDRTVALRRRGKPVCVLKVIRTGRGRQAMDEARRLVAEMEAGDLRVLHLREAASRQAVRRTIACCTLSTLVAFSLLLLASSLYRRERLESERAAAIVRRRGRGRKAQT